MNAPHSFNVSAKKNTQEKHCLPLCSSKAIFVLIQSASNIWFLSQNTENKKTATLWHSDGNAWSAVKSDLPSWRIRFAHSSSSALWIFFSGSEERGVPDALFKSTPDSSILQVPLPNPENRIADIKIREPGDIWLVAGNRIYRNKKPSSVLELNESECVRKDVRMRDPLDDPKFFIPNLVE